MPPGAVEPTGVHTFLDFGRRMLCLARKQNNSHSAPKLLFKQQWQQKAVCTLTAVDAGHYRLRCVCISRNTLPLSTTVRTRPRTGFSKARLFLILTSVNFLRLLPQLCRPNDLLRPTPNRYRYSVSGRRYMCAPE